MNNNFQQLAKRLASHPTASTAHMELDERAEGIEQMLQDLNMLARKDGCVAAAWALEFISHTNAKALPSRGRFPRMNYHARRILLTLVDSGPMELGDADVAILRRHGYITSAGTTMQATEKGREWAKAFRALPTAQPTKE